MRVIRQEDIVEITRVELKDAKMRVFRRKSSAGITRVELKEAKMRVVKTKEQCDNYAREAQRS